MDTNFPYYSKYRSETVVKESLKLVQAEYEVNQERGRYITKDDILNLTITLETCKDVNEFLAVI